MGVQVGVKGVLRRKNTLISLTTPILKFPDEGPPHIDGAVFILARSRIINDPTLAPSPICVAIKRGWLLASIKCDRLIRDKDLDPILPREAADHNQGRGVTGRGGASS